MNSAMAESKTKRLNVNPPPRQAETANQKFIAYKF